jgi:predicted porin
MKKSLVALATLAAATGAFAQSPNARAITGSNVEIFGVFDAAVTKFTQDGGGSVLRMQGEGRNESSRLGFRGVEDMGGGWGAGFWLEAGMFVETGAGQNTTNNNTSAGQSGLSNGTSNATAVPDLPSIGAMQGLTFNRASTVSLINKDIGEFRLGRDYVPTFWNKTVFDPFGTVGAGAYTNLTYGTLNRYVAVAPPGVPAPEVRSSNSIGWLSQNMNGLRVQAMYALHEQLSGCTDVKTAAAGANADTGGNLCQGPNGSGKYTGFRLTYTSGPLTLAAASATTSYPRVAAVAGTPPVTSGTVSAYQGDYKDNNFAAAYQLGATRLLAQMGTQTFGDFQRGYAAGTGYAAGIENTTQRTLKNTMLGFTHAMGPWTLKGSLGTAKFTGGQVSYAADRTAPTTNIEDGAKSKQTAVGAVYDLSKRTALYGTYSRLTTTGKNTVASMGIGSLTNATVGESKTATGIDLGVRHRF